MKLTEKQLQMYSQCNFIENKNLQIDNLEYLTEAEQDHLYKQILEGIFGKVIVDLETKTFRITRMNFNKFMLRIKEMYESKGLANLFDKRYSAWSLMMWEKEKITRSQMKIIELTVPLFFALEIYRLFLEIGEFYELPWYKQLSKAIYSKTWISNWETKGDVNIDLKPLDKMQFKPKDFQLDFIKKYNTLKHIYDLEGYILSFDQGLGKTFTSIGLSECLHKDQVIIVCPNSLKENWAYEIKQYFKKYSLNEYQWKLEVYVHGIDKLSHFNKGVTKYLIVNQEAIEKIYSYVDRSSNRNSMIIVDESHNFRNSDSKRTTELLKLKELVNCKDNLLMSGTPIKALPNELIPSLRMIDPYFTADLAKKYEKAFNSNKVEIARIVKERFDRTIYRKTKEQVLKLPKKDIQPYYVRVKNEEQFYMSTIHSDIIEKFLKIYDEKLVYLRQYEEEFCNLVEIYSDATPRETARYLRYVTCKTDPNQNDIQVHEYRKELYDKFLKEHVFPNITNQYHTDRLKFLISQYINMYQSAMGIAIGRVLPEARSNCFLEMWKQNYKEFLRMIDNNTKKTIIFTQFLPVANYISNDLISKGYNNVKIVGSTKNRMDEINKFKYSDEVDILIATTQTLSTGVTLTEANQMFFFGTPYRSADFDQACDRIYRIGQTSDVMIWNVLLESDERNISNRINDIMEWSGEMFDTLID